MGQAREIAHHCPAPLAKASGALVAEWIAPQQASSPESRTAEVCQNPALTVRYVLGMCWTLAPAAGIYPIPSPRQARAIVPPPSTSSPR